jgi:hypothetical protein
VAHSPKSCIASTCVPSPRGRRSRPPRVRRDEPQHPHIGLGP